MVAAHGGALRFAVAVVRCDRQEAQLAPVQPLVSASSGRSPPCHRLCGKPDWLCHPPSTHPTVLIRLASLAQPVGLSSSVTCRLELAVLPSLRKAVAAREHRSLGEPNPQCPLWPPLQSGEPVVSDPPGCPSRPISHQRSPHQLPRLRVHPHLCGQPQFWVQAVLELRHWHLPLLDPRTALRRAVKLLRLRRQCWRPPKLWPLLG
mmetsp:Transcript_21327/g.54462  ORF Transcript_21327/g.54462 Transcript_21327/m.54462 type:complete len:205 (-) Transcript_21327:51-665(-)